MQKIQLPRLDGCRLEMIEGKADEFYRLAASLQKRFTNDPFGGHRQVVFGKLKVDGNRWIRQNKTGRRNINTLKKTNL